MRRYQLANTASPASLQRLTLGSRPWVGLFLFGGGAKWRAIRERNASAEEAAATTVAEDGGLRRLCYGPGTSTRVPLLVTAIADLLLTNSGTRKTNIADNESSRGAAGRNYHLPIHGLNTAGLMAICAG
jgi:hypothetical protein